MQKPDKKTIFIAFVVLLIFIKNPGTKVDPISSSILVRLPIPERVITKEVVRTVVKEVPVPTVTVTNKVKGDNQLQEVISHCKSKAYSMTVARFWKTAVEEQKKYGMPASVKLAQMIVESGKHLPEMMGPEAKRADGKVRGYRGYNYFNIKAYINKNGQLKCPKHIDKAFFNECVKGYHERGDHDADGKPYKAYFLTFKSPWMAMRYHSVFVNQPHYAKHLKDNSVKSWIVALKKGRFAESRTYSKKLNDVIKSNKLYLLDSI